MEFSFDLPLTINGHHVAEVEMVATLERGYEHGDWHVGALAAIAVSNGRIVQTTMRIPHPADMSFEAQCYRTALHLVEQGELAERASQLFFETDPDWLPSDAEHRLRKHELV